jgi:hypothetical protein
MVLPAGLAQGLQGPGRGQWRHTVNLIYSPTMHGPGAFATRASAETFVRSTEM